MKKVSLEQKRAKHRARVARQRARIRAWLKSKGYRSIEGYVGAMMKADRAGKKK